MLQSHVLPNLRELQHLEHVTFQQGGAPPHFANRSRELLTTTFGERIIGRGFPHNWPARSPDLTPLDYYFWGALKNRVYNHGRPQNLQQLRERIEAEVEATEQAEIGRAVDDIIYRCQYLKTTDGGIFEHFK